jgi:NAD(P)-dependent dehydrogenase (short-subunit alcohol dehydrogenase family)
MSLSGRVALVTAGHLGIGRAISLGLAEDGADIALSYRSDARAAEECVRAIEALGRRARAYASDAADLAACESLAREARADLGPIEILICNAGSSGREAPVRETPASELEAMLRLNAIAPHQLARAVLPEMRARRRGSIVAISSIVTDRRGAGYAPYAMSKAALEAFVSVLAKEEHSHAIRVNCVAPGLVSTEMGRRYVRSISGQEAFEPIAGSLPFGRVCTPEEVAHAVRFLVSDRAGYVNGERIRVDGGA